MATGRRKGLRSKSIQSACRKYYSYAHCRVPRSICVPWNGGTQIGERDVSFCAFQVHRGNEGYEREGHGIPLGPVGGQDLVQRCRWNATQSDPNQMSRCPPHAPFHYRRPPSEGRGKAGTSSQGRAKGIARRQEREEEKRK
jgi:hypothetical protein